MSTEAPAAKKRKTRCSNCGGEGHNKASCIRNAQTSSSTQPAIIQHTENRGLPQTSRRWRDIGEIDDEKEEDDNNIDDDDITDEVADEDVDDWTPEELEWEEWLPSREAAPDGPDGTSLPKFGRESWGANIDHPDVTRDGFEYINVMHILGLFLTDAIMQKMLTATNAYGNLYVRGWKKNADIHELNAFLGIVLFMGLIGYPSRKDLFGLGPCRNDFVRSVIQRDRFEQLLHAWHYEDYSQYTAQEIIHHKKDDPFWPVTAFCSDIRARFRALYTPGQTIDVDEACIPFKGRHKCRCYNKDKPNKRHFKLYEVNDSKTKYTWDFREYRGKAEQRPVGVSATAWPVIQLLSHDIFKFLNYVLATDNWYTSFEILMFCIKMGMHYLGTIQVKRKGVPLSFKAKYGERQTHERGTYITMHSVYLQEDIYYTTWVDNKVVNMLHTMPSFKGTCTRRIKVMEADRVNHTWELKELDQPTTFPIYNSIMGGTDGSDQLIEVYRPYLKTVSWVNRFFSHLLTLIESNAFIWVVNAIDKLDLQFRQKVNHKDWRWRVVSALVDNELQKKELEDGIMKERTQSKKKWNTDYSRLRGRHFPKEMSFNLEERASGSIQTRRTQEEFDASLKRKNKFKRSKCILCETKVPTQCEQCNVFLCTKTVSGGTNCWKTFHTERDFMPGAIVNEENDADDDED